MYTLLAAMTVKTRSTPQNVSVFKQEGNNVWVLCETTQQKEEQYSVKRSQVSVWDFIDSVTGPKGRTDQKPLRLIMKTSSPSQSQSSSHKLYQLADLEPEALF